MYRRSFLWAAAKPRCRTYDVCVIGAGPAGLTAALHASTLGKSVCLIERARVGGADLWDGALQSKTMWEMAKFNARARSFGGSIFGGTYLDDISLNEGRIQEALRTVSEVREKHFLQQLEDSGVVLEFGRAEFQSPKEIHIVQEAKYIPVRADYFVIATGSVPRPHPDFYTDGETIVTSDHVMKQSIPKSIVIIGAGVIGCEFASIYSNLGKTHVSIIEKASRMLPMEDEDVASYIEERLTKKGVRFHHHSALQDLQVMDSDEEGVEPFARYTVRSDKGEDSTFDVERALVSIGRIPNYSGLGLEKAGCSVRNGKLHVDEHQRCLPHKHMYAVGDATVDIALVNMGETEAVTCVDHMFRPQRETPLNTDNLSTIMFLDQEVAAVGLNEQQCQKQNVAYLAARYGNEFVSRAVAMGAPEGFVKIIVTDDHQKTVLGVRAVGVHASSIVELASLAIHNKQSVYDLFDMIAAYPAMTQGFQECCRMLLGRSILKPGVFKGLHTWSWAPEFKRGRAYLR